tara:strand:- start:349 stop:582 length:234 start_codon:yes stop_codon:yes gene_type:complete
MGKPIYRVLVDFKYRRKGAVRAYRNGKIDTFVLSNDIEQIKKDKTLQDRIRMKVKSKEQIEIKYSNIFVEGQYGETI